MSRRDAVTTETPAPILRTYRRFSSNELAGLRTARVKWGSEISIVDLSIGGVRFEIPGELAPKARPSSWSSSGETRPCCALHGFCGARASREQPVTVGGRLCVQAPVSRIIFRQRNAPAARPRSPETKSRVAAGRGEVSGWTADSRLHPRLQPDESVPAHFAGAVRRSAEFVSMIKLDALFFGRDAQPRRATTSSRPVRTWCRQRDEKWRCRCRTVPR